MSFRQTKQEITLNDKEAGVALAFLGNTDTFRLMSKINSDLIGFRNLHRYNMQGKHPEASPEELDTFLREEDPQYYEFKIPYDHRAPLLSAFVLGAEGQPPNRTELIEELSPEEIITVAQVARDNLLALTLERV